MASTAATCTADSLAQWPPFSMPSKCSQSWSIGPLNRYTVNSEVVTRHVSEVSTITSHVTQTFMQLYLYHIRDPANLTATDILRGHESCLPSVAPNSCRYSFWATALPEWVQRPPKRNLGQSNDFDMLPRRALNTIATSSADGVTAVYCYGFGRSKADVTSLFDEIGGELDRDGKYDVEFYAPALTAVHYPVYRSATKQPALPEPSFTEIVKNTGSPVSEHGKSPPDTSSIGVGVGVGLVGLFLFLSVLFFLCRLRKKRQKGTGSLDASWGKPELLGSPVDKTKDLMELDSGTVHEMDAQDSRFKTLKKLSQAEAGRGKQMVEADSVQSVVEVEADRPAVEAPTDTDTPIDAIKNSVSLNEKL